MAFWYPPKIQREKMKPCQTLNKSKPIEPMAPNRHPYQSRKQRVQGRHSYLERPEQGKNKFCFRINRSPSELQVWNISFTCWFAYVCSGFNGCRHRNGYGVKISRLFQGRIYKRDRETLFVPVTANPLPIFPRERPLRRFAEDGNERTKMGKGDLHRPAIDLNRFP